MKRVVLNFIGGFRDGEILASDSPDPIESQNARNIFVAMTGGGEIGQRFRCRSEASWDELKEVLTPDGKLAREPVLSANHCYQVTDRIETDHEVRVRLEYQGQL